MAKTVTIGSAAFKNIFLRLDGTGVTQPIGPGGGVANAQFGPGPMQQFRLEDGPTARSRSHPWLSRKSTCVSTGEASPALGTAAS